MVFEKTMRDAGYDVQRIAFNFELLAPPRFSQSAPVQVDYIDQTDFDVMNFSGSDVLTDTK